MPIFFIPSSTTIIYTLALHDALPISEFFLQVANQCGVLGTKGKGLGKKYLLCGGAATLYACHKALVENALMRSEEHTSELQSRPHLVCRLLLEKKRPAAEAGAWPNVP